jgi:lysozyme
MKLSTKGLDLIKAAEGYKDKQHDGSCKSYRCPAGVWTCGWGCTEGVGPNTHWTKDEATEALAREMWKHESAVLKMVTVPLHQGQFDALVSLCYNVGEGTLKKSTLLKHLNAGDYARASSHFADFKRAKVRGATARLYKVKDGTSVVLPGLVTRRAAETQLFLEAAPQEEMPQAVEPETTKMRVAEAVKKIAVPASLATSGAAVTAAPSVPTPPVPDLSNLTAWQSVINTGKDLALWGAKSWPWVAAAVAVYFGLAYALPWLQEKRA